MVPDHSSNSKPKIRIQKTSNVDLIKGIFNETLPGDTFDIEKDDLFLLTVNGSIAGFCSGRYLENENIYYLSMAGVLDIFKGRGYQRKLIQKRVRYAKKLGAMAVITYTIPSNSPSINNLIKEGFITYIPQNSWIEGNVIYWMKAL